MAQSFVPKQISPSFLVLVLAATIYLAKANHNQLIETKLSLYAQDFSALGASPNTTTAIPVAGIAGKAWTFTQFGTLYVVEYNTLTETADPKSPKVGQLQGMYITSDLDGLNTHVSASVVFTNKAYNGSSLQLLGISKQFEAVREVSVVGGTGKFRLARGYATFENYFLDIATQYSVLRCNVSMQHY